MGHAIECRICVEDPKTMLPAPGTVTAFESTQYQGIRFDHCIYNGFEVKSDFDPMIGKLIARGFNRDVAIRKVRKALDDLFIDGIKTNIELHKVILDENTFKGGNYDTNYINKVDPNQFVKPKGEEELIKRLVAIEINTLSRESEL
jgi:acetyl-CoA carboxylase biotin carboxylase subunit